MNTTRVLALAVPLMFTGCGAPGTCVPGETATCACPDGRSSTRSCTGDEAFSACACAPLSLKRVFVTSSQYEGDLGGLAGADEKCNLAAQAGQLEGTFKAWLSTSQVNAVDRIADVGPWYLPGTDTIAFNNRANLTTSPLHPILVTEQGRPLEQYANVEVWTGMTSGSLGDTNCRDWTVRFGKPGDPSSLGSTGLADRTTRWWTEGPYHECRRALRLYCLEQ